jgi:hypothetical protein
VLRKLAGDMFGDAALSIAEWHMRQGWLWKDIQRWLTTTLTWRRIRDGRTDNGGGERGRG